MTEDQADMMIAVLERISDTLNSIRDDARDSGRTLNECRHELDNIEENTRSMRSD